MTLSPINRRRIGPAAALSVVLAVIAVGFTLNQGGSHPTPVTTPAVKIALKPGEPPLGNVSRQRSTQVDRQASITLSPPRTDFRPPVTAQQAENTAWGQHGPPGHAKAADATLAMFTSPEQKQPVAVWLITFSDGACTPSFGGPGKTGPTCSKQPWREVINATNGKDISSYSDDLVVAG